MLKKPKKGKGKDVKQKHDRTVIDQLWVPISIINVYWHLLYYRLD